MRSCFRRLCAIVCVTAMLITSAAALSVEDAVTLLEERFVGELPEAAYSAETLDELFDSLGDPYTYYMTAEEYQSFLQDVEGDTSVTGIGASVLLTPEGILISSLLPGGSAEEAGLVSGDLIIAVDGVSCVPAAETHRAMIVGEEGTHVSVTVRHTDGSRALYRLERRYIEIHNTTVTLRDGVGYIDCDSFGSETGTYFAEGIPLYDDAAHIWVVDLRGNPGGTTTAAIASLGAFTGAGRLLYFRDKAGDYYYNAHYENYLTPDPVIVLTNSSSASASEVFAAGIRDQIAGISVGSRTFGKGSAQSVLNSNNYPEYFDSDGLKVSIYRFYSPDGNTTDKIGVIPTLLVNDEYTEAVAQLLCAEKPLRAEGYLHLKLAGWDFYVELEQAQSEEYRSSFMELLSALPPEAEIEQGSGRKWVDITAAEALAVYGAEEYSRWFTDVSESEYATEINTLATYGILKGTGDALFRPTDTLTRAQLCALIAQALDISATSSDHFTDVPAERWYADSINAMAEMGLVTGRGGGVFDPNGIITQQEYITIMGRLVAFLNFYGYEQAAYFTDEMLSEDERFSSFASWARNGAAVLTTLLENNDGETVSMLHDELENIDPTAPILREEAAATLCNVLEGLRIIAY